MPRGATILDVQQISGDNFIIALAEKREALFKELTELGVDYNPEAK